LLLSRHHHTYTLFVVNEVVCVLGVLAQVDLHPVDLAIEPAAVGGIVGAAVVPDS
jgi:hypothetical protein